MRHPASLVGVLFCALLLPTGNARAVGMQRSDLTPAVSACQAKNAGYDSAFTRRNFGMLNEGKQVVYLTCGLTIDTAANSQHAAYIMLYATNHAAASAVLKCTLIDGLFGPEFGTVRYFARSMTVAPGTNNHLDWSGTMSEAGSFLWPTITCAVPPGIEVNYLTMSYTELVGP